jgi:hypothetical protein
MSGDGRAGIVIIFGLRTWWRTIGQGMFHCRQCGADRQYRHRAGRRWFTLFFIPLIPLNKVGENVMCTTCKTRYQPAVLG